MRAATKLAVVADLLWWVIDEASRIEHADQVEAATSATADVRIWGSSINPQNENNFFARKYNSLPPERVFRFHYSQHPIWTPAKIARKKSDMSPESWAAEFEIDDSYTVEDITIPALWVQSCVKLKALCEEKGIKLEPSPNGVAGGDVGGGKGNERYHCPVRPGCYEAQCLGQSRYH